VNSSRANAERIARQAHAVQVDRAGAPFIGHIERVVANLVRRWPDATDDEIAAAWLHDVIEDTGWSRSALVKAGISADAVSIVQELSKPDGETYLPWIASLAATGTLSAVKVKIADNEDNSDPARVAELNDDGVRLHNRYVPARTMLEKRLQAGT
jgi:(p)ppGpp synthase/HD superfamily hydrolase